LRRIFDPNTLSAKLWKMQRNTANLAQLCPNCLNLIEILTSCCESSYLQQRRLLNTLHIVLLHEIEISKSSNSDSERDLYTSDPCGDVCLRVSCIAMRSISRISSAVTEGTSRPAAVMNHGAGLSVVLFMSPSPYQFHRMAVRMTNHDRVFDTKHASVSGNQSRDMQRLSTLRIPRNFDSRKAPAFPRVCESLTAVVGPFEKSMHCRIVVKGLCENLWQSHLFGPFESFNS